LVTDEFVANSQLSTIAIDEDDEEENSRKRRYDPENGPGTWLLEVEQALWEVVHSVLQYGPLIFTPPVSNHPTTTPPTYQSAEEFKKHFDYQDIFICYFAFLEGFLKHAARHLQLSKTTECLLPFANLHAEMAIASGGRCIEYLFKWTRVAQSYCIANVGTQTNTVVFGGGGGRSASNGPPN